MVDIVINDSVLDGLVRVLEKGAAPYTVRINQINNVSWSYVHTVEVNSDTITKDMVSYVKRVNGKFFGPLDPGY